MEQIDLDAPADVYVGFGSRRGKRPLSHRRFKTRAEAIRFVIEGLSIAEQSGAVVETDDVRLTTVEIRKIYERADFPVRPAVSAGG